MSFFDELQKNIDGINQMQRTENGAVGYKSTGHKLLDMNYSIPKYRKAAESEIIADFEQAYREDGLNAILWMFYARDVRGGLGERRLFRILLRWLCANENRARQVLNQVDEYGRWDDLIYATKGTPVWRDTVEIIKAQLVADYGAMGAGKPISLLGKWLPSERASSSETRATARKLAADMGLKIQFYNRMLSRLRKYSDVVEVKMSAREWSAIDYSAVPTYANLKYKDAFLRNDEERRRAYLEALNKGETKINASTAFPHDIVRKYMDNVFGAVVDPAVEAMWRALPQMDGLADVMVVADGSGSMYNNQRPRPIEVAVSLAIYCAEHCKGEFNNKYITFSQTPRFVDLSGCSTLLGKVMTAMKHNEVANTNIEAVFQIILDTAIEKNARLDELPKTILIISDMEFDDCTETCEIVAYTGYYYHEYARPDDALFEKLRQRYRAYGYQLPRLVFWNVASRTGTIPIKENELGVTLVSGYSVSILKMILSGETDPYKNLIKTLHSERYLPIYRALS